MEQLFNDEHHYRDEFKKHFMDSVKNCYHPQRYRTPESTPAQHFKEQVLKSKQTVREYEQQLQGKQPRYQVQARTSGGDADRVFNENFNIQQKSELFRQQQRNNGDKNYTFQQLHHGHALAPPPPPPAMPASLNSRISKHNLLSTAADDEDYTDPTYIHEMTSNCGGIDNGSETSAKSQMSPKTVVSRKSSRDLRKIVKSQCKLKEMIDETLNEHYPEIEVNVGENPNSLNSRNPLTLSQCKRCSDCVNPRQSQKNVTTEIGRGDFLDCRNTDTLTISVDDVVNSKVINPMIRKLQRMYLNNLKEEMSLMEDLERLPQKVNEVYKATIFKQKD